MKRKRCACGVHLVCKLSFFLTKLSFYAHFRFLHLTGSVSNEDSIWGLCISYLSLKTQNNLINVKRLKKTLQSLTVVPPGIEPGTQGFSVLCSTN